MFIWLLSLRIPIIETSFQFFETLSFFNVIVVSVNILSTQPTNSIADLAVIRPSVFPPTMMKSYEGFVLT